MKKLICTNCGKKVTKGYQLMADILCSKKRVIKFSFLACEFDGKKISAEKALEDEGVRVVQEVLAKEVRK